MTLPHATRSSRCIRPAPLLLALLTAVLAGALAVGCEETEISYLDVQGLEPDVVEDTVAPADVPPEDTAPSERVVGDPCTEDEGCPTEWCATTESVSTLLRRDYELTGGLCTLLFCADDETCGAEAVCRDGGGFALCAQTCSGYQGCRYTQGWACAAGPASSDPAPADPDSTEDAAAAACLPVDGVVATRCGDGVCDESERWVADQCPADCPTPAEAPFPAGAPCTPAQARDCVPGFCLVKAVLTPLFPDVEMDVPNGYCTTNPLGSNCTSDDECGEGGVCADASALAGQPLSLCLHACESDADCRYVEGYRCFATGEGDDAQKGCLPGSVVAAIRCGDGVCDPAEAANPEQCSELDYQGDCQ